MGTSGNDRLTGGTVPSFIAGRGGDDRIRGGPKSDELSGGPGGDGLVGGAGRDYIIGGSGKDRLLGGADQDFEVDPGGATVVKTGQGRHYVDVRDKSGDDRVSCRRSKSGVVYADRRDSIASSCYRGRVLFERPPARVSTSPNITGSGTNDDPYTGPCDSSLDSAGCAVEFPIRSLKSMFASEYVLAYKCPSDHPWLLNKNYSPGRAVPNGVDVQELIGGHTGVSISGISQDVGKVQDRHSFWYRTGTKTGFPSSSATSWTPGGSSYYIRLHCTDDLSKATLERVTQP